MSEVFIQAVGSDGSDMQYLLSISEEPPWRITISSDDEDDLVFEADDLFNALVDLREKLDRSGIKLLCNGARKDVYPSGMSRSMGGGRKAYVIRKGHPARMASLLDIFDPADIDSVVSVCEQQAFHEEWFASLE